MRLFSKRYLYICALYTSRPKFVSKSSQRQFCKRPLRFKAVITLLISLQWELRLPCESHTFLDRSVSVCSIKWRFFSKIIGSDNLTRDNTEQDIWYDSKLSDNLWRRCSFASRVHGRTQRILLQQNTGACGKFVTSVSISRPLPLRSYIKLAWTQVYNIKNFNFIQYKTEQLYRTELATRRQHNSGRVRQPDTLRADWLNTAHQRQLKIEMTIEMDSHFNVQCLTSLNSLSQSTF